MKKTIYLFFVSLVLFSFTANAQVTNTVTFVADLSVLIPEGFDPVSDSIEVAGLDWDNGDDVTITGDRLMTVDPNDANLYMATLTIETSANLVVGDSLRWKFHAFPDANFDPSWEGNIDGTEWDGRSYKLQDNGTVVTLDPLQPEGIQVFEAGLTNTVTFKADLTNLVGTGTGFFDPAIDGIEVRGFWSGEGADAEATVVGGPAPPLPMTRNLDPGVVYETTATIQLAEGLPVGTTTRWKFKTFPDDRWADDGWEFGSGYLYAFQEDGAQAEEKYEPNVVALLGPLGKDVTVLFQCIFPDNALNWYDSSAIPQDEVEFIILKGDNPAIGDWGGQWVADDTLTAGAIAMYDKGTHGDLVAGDNIYSREVVFADTINQGGVIYKFGAGYPNAGVVSQSTPLDNMRGGGQNFTFIIEPVDTTVILAQEWWFTTDRITSVEEIEGQVPSDYTLEQNYPNPFNPSTKIRYSVPAESEVSLKVFDLLGREVSTLVNTKQGAGNYEATFDATRLATGIYFYRLDAGGVSISKKMMFIK